MCRRVDGLAVPSFGGRRESTGEIPTCNICSFMTVLFLFLLLSLCRYSMNDNIPLFMTILYRFTAATFGFSGNVDSPDTLPTYVLVLYLSLIAIVIHRQRDPSPRS
ncbi:uncharacterized protein F4817DRAFT_345892 [Daldinia loculata]|uniref:uncharacterized protein n=1 Tax=Daldinia loculata TaxID=103429 RepID=UPI0020C23AB1|nr:uncharacterized protein F4817DRAFT_345892 [Daldinia loculata]KAI1644825.1 hypothetical protein F4817DRAFT_345892 [Daldinia loculata]